MAPISSIMHRFSFRILRYLNDWLILGSSLQEIVRARDFLLSLCNELGVLVSLANSSLTPTQTLHYLGMTLQSTPLRAFPTQARIQKVLSGRRVLLFSRAAAQSLAIPFGGDVIVDCSRSRFLPPHAVVTAPPQCCGSSTSGARADFLGRLLPPGSSVVVGRRPSCRGCPARSPSTTSPSLYGRVRLRVGGFACGLRTSYTFRSTTANFWRFCWLSGDSSTS